MVLFNHMADARAAALDLFAAALGEHPPRAASGAACPDWIGPYLDPETGLCTRIDELPDGRLRLRYGHHPEVLDVNADGSASAPGLLLAPEGH